MGEEKSLENPQIPKKKLSPLKDLKNSHFRGEIPTVEILRRLANVASYQFLQGFKRRGWYDGEETCV